jgi:hypothetical protein
LAYLPGGAQVGFRDAEAAANGGGWRAERSGCGGGGCVRGQGARGMAGNSVTAIYISFIGINTQ